MLYPLILQPIFKERVWGGREIQQLYGKNLPPGKRIGESWEISDRPGDVNVILNGPLAGKDLRWLMETHMGELLGGAKTAGQNRFPLLCKILDAREKLSLQVHPPANKAAELGGEPKTEMWWITNATPGAELYVGLKRGVTRAAFEKKIQEGNVAECFYRVPVKAGDAMFLPSGRVHAIGAGIVIFEIQQNSDTTYRVFDWNRVGLNGEPRALHVAESLASMDFNDFEPTLVQSQFTGSDIKSRQLVNDLLFSVEAMKLRSKAETSLKPCRLQIVAAVCGQLQISAGSVFMNLAAGQFCLIPACLEETKIAVGSDATLLRIEAN